MNNREPLWTRTDHILADLFDAVQWNTYVTQAAASGKPGTEPKPYPRPNAPTKQPAITADALIDFQRRTRGE